MQPYIVVGVVTRPAAHFVDPASRTRRRTYNPYPRADSIAVGRDSNQTDAKPMVVIFGQIDKQKWEVTHIIDDRFQPAVVPKIAYCKASARLRLSNART